MCIVASFKLSCVCCYVYCCTVWALLCLFVFYLFIYTLDAGLLARSQYSEGPTTGHLDTFFSWFPCA